MSTFPTVIDLYSGVGGLSLGAVKAGFNLKGAVEKERRAIESHSKNFWNSRHICADVSQLDGRAIIRETGAKRLDLAGLIGGPPCQGFSMIGKREITDERNSLFSEFFRLVVQLRPGFFLAENVPGILHERYSEIIKRAMAPVQIYYDILEPIKITASEFGAATTRTRVFFVGVRKGIGNADKIPEAIERMKTTKPVFVKDALHGLPLKILDDWNSYASSWQKLDGRSLQNRYLVALNATIENLGDSFAVDRYLNFKEVSGNFVTRHSPEVKDRYSKLKPGQQDNVSKSVKLKADGFCPTLRAGTDSLKGSFQAVRPIHFTESRVITPREAARLQGFPDWFQFHETIWHSFRQIGNSVSPIVAEKVLKAIKTSLNM